MRNHSPIETLENEVSHPPWILGMVSFALVLLLIGLLTLLGC